ncbi:MAG: Hsp20/alpha crystallin family protein [bacterium]
MPKIKKSVPVEEPAAPEMTEEFVQTTDHEAPDWFADEQYDGQLAVDVFQTPDAIVIKSAIAGVEPDDLDIAVQRDIVTIRGRRKRQEVVNRDDYLFQECYWGSFSRSIILPVEVDPDRVHASMKSGILRITLPKSATSGPHRVHIESEDEE